LVFSRCLPQRRDLLYTRSFHLSRTFFKFFQQTLFSCAAHLSDVAYCTQESSVCQELFSNSTERFCP